MAKKVTINTPLSSFDADWGGTYHTGDPQPFPSEVTLRDGQEWGHKLSNVEDTIKGKVHSEEANIGYYVCDTAVATAAKTVAATDYALITGGAIKIKMTYANSANNATLNINSTGAKALYYDGARASSSNTWEAGEVLDVYYDGTNFQANNAAGGGKFASGEKVKEVSIATGINAGDKGLAKSGEVYKNVHVTDILLDKEESVKQITEYVSGKCINTNGVIGDYESYSVSNPLSVKKGELLVIKAKCSSGICLVGKVRTVNERWDSLLNGQSNARVITYYCYIESDCAVQFSYATASGIEVTVYNSKIIDDLVKKVTDLETAIDRGFLFRGFATPSSTPSNVTGKIFYIALQEGTYTNYGSVVGFDGLNIISYDGEAWSIQNIYKKDGAITVDSPNFVTSGIIATALGLDTKNIAFTNAVNSHIDIFKTVEAGTKVFIKINSMLPDTVNSVYVDVAFENNMSDVVNVGTLVRTNGYLEFTAPIKFKNIRIRRVNYTFSLDYDVSVLGIKQDIDKTYITLQNQIDKLKNAGSAYVGIATTSTNPGTPTTKVFYIATVAGTYTNFLDSNSAALVLTQGINIIKYDGVSWSVEQIVSIDDKPIANSPNFVKGSGIYSEEEKTRKSIKFYENAQEVSESQNGKFIQTSGVRGNYADASISTVIELKKGETLVVREKSNTAMCAIAKVNTSSSWTALVIGDSNNVKDYTYTANENMQVQCSYFTEDGISAAVYGSDEIIKLNERLLNTTNVYHIGHGSGFDYQEIQDAFDAVTDDSANNRYVFIVHPGTYSRVSNTETETRTRYISLIGLDRLSTIVYEDSGKYSTPPFECKIDGTVENMSFIMRTTNETFDPDYKSGEIRPAYALHIDFSDARTTLFKNCYFESNTGPAVGLGTYANNKFIFENCEAVRIPFKNEDDLGAWYYHGNASANVPNQELVLRNCTADNRKESQISRGFMLSKVQEGLASDVTLVIQNCCSVGTNGPKAILSNLNLSTRCFGNNVSTLNYST